MILENFKSYAGKQEIGPFHKRFSSIVGPNGSGKSNVIDALLFVFGKRAKQLRLNKVSELIHKSANYPNLDYAKVEVHFQLIVVNTVVQSALRRIEVHGGQPVHDLHRRGTAAEEARHRPGQQQVPHLTGRSRADRHDEAQGMHSS